MWMLLLLAACSGSIEEPLAGPGGGAPLDPDPTGPGAFAPVDAPTRRLTRDEYAYTVEDLLGVRLSGADLVPLPVDRPIDGFVGISAGQTALPDHVRAYAELAAVIVSRLDLPAFLATHGADLVASAGELLFRRPLDARERGAFGALLAAVEADGEPFEVAAAAVLEAMLQSPQFLYRLEVERADSGGLRAVGGHEMASRLSYLLWASAPDAELRAAASDGRLDSASGVLEQVDRMLEDRARVERVLRRFVVDWAGLESIPDDDGLRAELIASTEAFYVDHVEREGRLLELLTTTRAFLTPALAAAQGLDAAGDGVREYDTSSLEGRGGLLSQPGVVAGMTNSDGGEIVARGLFLQRQLFCREAPDPPASLQAEIEAFVAELPPDASARQIAEARLERPECAACHAQFDPLAYGMERFDHRGRYRLTDEHGNRLRGDGWVPEAHSGDGERMPYADLAELSAWLSDSHAVAACFTRRQLENMLGSRLGRAHDGSVEALSEVLTGEAGSHGELVRALVADDLFRLRPVEPTEASR